MKYPWFVGAGVVAAGLVAGIFFWQRGQAAHASPQELADKIVSGKAFELKDGLTFKPTSPAADYFALPAGSQRVAYLDKMIDMQEETRKKIASGEIKLPEGAEQVKVRPSKSGNPDELQTTSIKRETSPDGTKQSVSIRLNADDLSPALRAQMQEYHAALHERRKDRGLDPNAPMMIIRSETRTEKK